MTEKKDGSSIRTERERNPLAKEFAKTVEAKAFYSYSLPEGTKVNGGGVRKGDGYDVYYSSDHNKLFLFSKLESEAANILLDIRTIRGKTEPPEISHIVSMGHLDKKRSREYFRNKDLSVLAIQFPQYSSIDCCGNERGFMEYSRSEAGVLFPKKTAEHFLDEIKKDPDLVEDFYQEAFKGLDSKGVNSPGLRRVKSAGFYLVTESDRVKKYPHLTLEKLRVYIYRNGPYGTDDYELHPHLLGVVK